MADTKPANNKRQSSSDSSSTSSAEESDHKPFDKKSPLDRKPPFDRKPSFDRKSSNEEKAPIDKKTRFEKKPSFDKKPPPLEKKPSFDMKPFDDKSSNGPSEADTKLKIEENTEQRELSVDEIEKYRVIQAAKQMSRLSGSTTSFPVFPGEERIAKRLNSPLNSQTGSALNSKLNCTSSEVGNKNDLEQNGSNESDSSPQTVPKYENTSEKEDCDTELKAKEPETLENVFDKKKVESPASEPVKNEVQSPLARRSISPIPHSVRNKELGSPPQLVPTYKANPPPPRSYPADVTNMKAKQNCYPADIHLKEQFHQHQRPPDTHVNHVIEKNDQVPHDIMKTEMEALARPSVLNMSTLHKSIADKKCVRSSIDVAEKALKELRTSSFLHSQPEHYLHTNGHPSQYPHALHQGHSSAFSSHIPSSHTSRIIPDSHHSVLMSSRSSTVPPSSDILSLADSRREPRPNSVTTAIPHYPPHSALNHTSSYSHPSLHHQQQKHEQERREADHLNTLHRISQMHRSMSPNSQKMMALHRPSSLPMHPLHSREHIKPPERKSFSVESLASSDERKERSSQLDRHLSERSLPDRPLSDRQLPERPMPERPLPERPLPDRTLRDLPLPDRQLQERQLQERQLPDRSISERGLPDRVMDRMHVPDGYVFHNGLVKKPPDDWPPVHASHAHMERRYQEQKLLFDLLHEKDGRTPSSHRSAIPSHTDIRAHTDIRSPVRMGPPFMQRPTPASNGSPRGEQYSFPPGHVQQLYSHIHRLGSGNQFPNGLSRFQGR